MTAEPVFVDTNILVYAHDSDSGSKHIVAKNLLEELWENKNGRISLQVLQEFYVTLSQKLPKPLPRKTVRELISAYQAWGVYSPKSEDILTASKLQDKYSLSFWDSLVLVAAQNSGAKKLYSEDMQHGQKIGDVTIQNPFV